ncbi:MAG: hypothetical protein EU531_02685 [Promethearchaeota archaeon]|nr:MAG: hypothetical protein EU531_02685 [Candidatus Lokiarchaeota archaeon]
MKIVFFIQSSTVILENYTIKDIPGSSGRLDVISRSILAAMLGENGLDINIEVWVFLENYGTFIFNSNDFNDDYFPKNEILLSDYFVKYIRNMREPNPLKTVKCVNMNIFKALQNFINLNFQIFILDEDGQDFYPFFKNFNHNDNLLFIIGNQIGEIITSEDLTHFNFKRISLGSQSYLASSVIRLIKLNLRLII